MTFKNSFFKPVLSYEKTIIPGYQAQVKIQYELLTIIQSALPEHLCPHALHCVMAERKILLYTDSAIWSSQLRFYHQPILQKLKASDYGIFEEVKIKIIPKESVREQKKYLPSLSPENVELIFKQAENQVDKVLKKSLLKLGKTLKKIVLHYPD